MIAGAENRLAVARADVIRRLSEARVVPVATLDDGPQSECACRALLQGGIGCIEITFRTDAAPTAIRHACEVDGMLVGAGTLRTPEQVAAAVQAGAHFGVAPGLDAAVVEAAQRLELPFFPGVATPSEIDRARNWGFDIVKVFPAAALGGPDFLRAIAGPYPDMRFIPTGGISAENLADYLAVPAVLAAGGSWPVDRELLRAGHYHAVMVRAAAIQDA